MPDLPSLRFEWGRWGLTALNAGLACYWASRHSPYCAINIAGFAAGVWSRDA